MILWFFCILAGLVVLGVPLFVIIGILTALAFTFFLPAEFNQFSDFLLLIEKIFELTDKNVLLAIPFFVLAGNIMTAGKMAERQVNFARAMTGWLPGGLGIAAVLSCMFFAAISGSSPVTLIAIGSILYPALIKEGYRANFSAGLLTCAGSLGILIPPSIPMLIYCIMVGSAVTIAVGDLFLAGVLPGLLIGILLMIYGLIEGKRFHYPIVPFSYKRVWESLKEGVWSLLLPVIVLGGIYGGIFTPTEAAAVSVVYATAVEAFIHRQLEWGRLKDLLTEAAVMVGAIYIILVLALSLNEFFVQKQIAEQLLNWIKTLQLGPVTFLLGLNGLFLIVGCFMDSLSAIMILSPMLAPLGLKLGLDPIHLAIITIVNLEIGYLTPPIGINLFVASSLFKMPVYQLFRTVIPFVLIMGGALLFLTYLPGLSIGPLNWLEGKKFWTPLVQERDRERLRAIRMDSSDSVFVEESQETKTEGSRVLSIKEMMDKVKKQKEVK